MIPAIALDALPELVTRQVTDQLREERLSAVHGAAILATSPNKSKDQNSNRS